MRYALQGTRETLGTPPVIYRVMQLAGLLTWAVTGIPIVVELTGRPEGLSEWPFILWAVGYAVFGWAFWRLSSHEQAPLGRAVGLTLAGVMTFCALLTAWALPSFGVQGVLLVIVATGLVHHLSLPGAFVWVGVQSVVLTLIYILVGNQSPAEALIAMAVNTGFQAFALLASHATLCEARARAQLVRVNAELRATQGLLDESNRISERVRIARELHDLIGHHLTALSLNLEVASHVADGQARSHIEKSQALAKSLLADVREVVSSMRGGTSLDLARAITTLTADIPNLSVHLTLPDDLEVDDPQRAQVVLRCVQEVITNTVRHAAADNLWLTLERTPEGIRVLARDDGRGAKLLRAGNGLSGMKERLEALGGRLQVITTPGQGFSLDARLPFEPG